MESTRLARTLTNEEGSLLLTTPDGDGLDFRPDGNLEFGPEGRAFHLEAEDLERLLTWAHDALQRRGDYHPQ